MKHLIQLLMCLAWSFNYAQSPKLDWAIHLGNNGSIYQRAMALDNEGNIYQAGTYNFGPMDFDAGPDSFYLKKPNSPVGRLNDDIYVSKSDASGRFIWAKCFGGLEQEEAYSIAVDASGNVYFTGSFKDTADFDPGPGVYNLTGNGTSDIFVCKLNANGDLVWAKQIVGSSAIEAHSIALDGTANVHLTGYFQFTVDFDPGPGTTNLTAAGDEDIFVCKLNTSGDFLWAKQIGGVIDDRGSALVIDNSSNIYITGYYEGNVDFDPGAGVFNLNTIKSNCFILKLNQSGDFVWATQLNLPEQVRGDAISLDNTGNIYIGGGGYGIAISKLNASGTILWSKLLSGLNCGAESIVADASGNVYTTGNFGGTVDFDPGSGSKLFTAGARDNAYVNMLNASGDYVWAHHFKSSFIGWGTAILLDADENIYSSGYFRGTVDFDPGNDSLNITSYMSYDAYLFKWDQKNTSGTNKNFTNAAVQLYPNPTYQNIQIALGALCDDVRLILTNNLGMVVHTQNEVKAENLTLELPEGPGIYFLRIEIENNLYAVKKIVKI